MNSEIAIHIPAARIDHVYPVIAQAPVDQAEIVIETTTKALRLADLRRLNFCLHGSGEQVRALDRILSGPDFFPGQMQRAAIAAWLGNAGAFGLYPQTGDFMAALLPRSAPLLRTTLSALFENS